jgi:hypothetical protein
VLRAPTLELVPPEPPLATFEWLSVLRRAGALIYEAAPPGGGVDPTLPLLFYLGLPAVDGLDLLTADGLPEARWEAWGMALNAGLHVAATGRSGACMDRPEGPVVGQVRVYAHVPGDFTLEGLTAALTGGHTFVTTGPLLFATLDGQPPGSVLDGGNTSRALRVEAFASGDPADRLTAVRVFRNGTEAVTVSMAPPGLRTFGGEWPVVDTEAAWYVVRAEGQTPNQVAVTSPFYVNPPGPRLVRVTARIFDAATAAPLAATLEVLEAREVVPGVRGLATHAVADGSFVGDVPVASTLRVRSPGYSTESRSVFFDTPLAGLLDRLRAGEAVPAAALPGVVDELLKNLVLEFAMKQEVPHGGSESRDGGGGE